MCDHIAIELAANRQDLNIKLSHDMTAFFDDKVVVELNDAVWDHPEITALETLSSRV